MKALKSNNLRKDESGIKGVFVLLLRVVAILSGRGSSVIIIIIIIAAAITPWWYRTCAATACTSSSSGHCCIPLVDMIVLSITLLAYHRSSSLRTRRKSHAVPRGASRTHAHVRMFVRFLTPRPMYNVGIISTPPSLPTTVAVLKSCPLFKLRGFQRRVGQPLSERTLPTLSSRSVRYRSKNHQRRIVFLLILIIYRP